MQIQKIKDIVIYRDEQFNSFPNVVVNELGEVMVAFRQAPDWQHVFNKVTHCDPASKAVYVTSLDGGHSWNSRTTTLYDDFYLGIQDPCLNVLQDGTLFCTYFTWKIFLESDVKNPIPGERKVYDTWIRRLGGAYSIRSRDSGRSWDRPLPIPQGQSVRGNVVELEDGSLVLAMYDHPDYPAQAVATVTRDHGVTWEFLAVIAKEDGVLFQEPNLYRTESGKLVAWLRTWKQNVPQDGRQHPLYVCESYDNGKTWINVSEQPVHSPSPFHALRLLSGNVLLTYGHRFMPGSGIRARLLDSECGNISEAEEVILREDGHGFDIGYPHAVQLPDGSILIVYYFYDEAERGKRYIAGTLCREIGE